MEVEMSFPQALMFRRCLFALRTVGVELRMSVFGSSLHLDAASDAQTAWLHVAFCSAFFRSLKIHRQPQPAGEDENGEGDEGERGNPVVCITLPIKHLWKVLTKALGPGGGGGSRLLRAEKIVLIGSNASLRIDLSFPRCSVDSTTIIPAAPGSWGFPCRLRWLRRHSLSLSSSTILRSLEDFLLPFEDLRLSHKPPPDKAVVLTGSAGDAGEGRTEPPVFGGEVSLHENVFDTMVFDPRLPSMGGLTFAGREMRAAAALCDFLGSPIALCYRTPGVPLVALLGGAATAAAAAAGSSCVAADGAAIAAAAAAGSPESFQPHLLLMHALLQQQLLLEKLQHQTASTCWAQLDEAAGLGSGRMRGEWKAGPVRGWVGLLWTSTSPSGHSDSAAAAAEAADALAAAEDTEEDEESRAAFSKVLQKLGRQQPPPAAAKTTGAAVAAAEPAPETCHAFQAHPCQSQQQGSAAATVNVAADASTLNQNEDWDVAEPPLRALELADPGTQAPIVSSPVGAAVTSPAASPALPATRTTQSSLSPASATAAADLMDGGSALTQQEEAQGQGQEQQNQQEAEVLSQQEGAPLFSALSRLFARLGRRQTRRSQKRQSAPEKAIGASQANGSSSETDSSSSRDTSSSVSSISASEVDAAKWLWCPANDDYWGV